MSLRFYMTSSRTAHSRQNYPPHRFPRNWSALDLADAIPLRLSERIRLGLVDFAAPAEAANTPFAGTAASPWRHRGYLRTTALPPHIRVR